MEKQAMSQMKRQHKAPEKQVNEPETGNFPEKEFKTIVQMQDLGKKAKVEKMQELFTKDLKQTDRQTIHWKESAAEAKEGVRGDHCHRTECGRKKDCTERKTA